MNDKLMEPIQQLTPPAEKAVPQHYPASDSIGSCQHESLSERGTTHPTSYFDQLPPEILTLIAIAVDESDHATTKALRCVSRDFTNICTRLVFRNTTLLLRQKSIQRLDSLLWCSELCSAVVNLTIDTAEFTDTCLDSYDWEDRDAQLLKSFLAVLTRLGRLQNLQSLSLRCSHECVGPQQRRRWWARGVPESIDFRSNVLQSLFTGLNSSGQPPPKMSQLSIENLQGCADDCLARSKDFHAVMSQVRKLELQIVTEDVDGNGSTPTNLGKKELHTFFGQKLAEHWLEPTRKHLTHLKLYARDMYLGYLPRCHLPFFPILKTLLIGGMSFTSDSQLDWILQHKRTLEELKFDNCTIVIGVRIPSTLDSSNYPIEPLFNSSVTGSILQPSSFSYNMRWHDYFKRLANELPALRSFRCGFGDWYNGNAFRTSEQLGMGLWAQRYRILDDGYWQRPPFDGGSYDGDWLEPPKYPDCTDDDWLALCEVRKVIECRTNA